MAWSRNTINARTGKWRCLERIESQCAPPGLHFRPPVPSHHPIKWLCAARRPKAKRCRRSRRRNHMQRRPPARKRGQSDLVEHVLDAMNARRTPCHTIQYTQPFFISLSLPTSRYVTARPRDCTSKLPGSPGRVCFRVCCRFLFRVRFGFALGGLNSALFRHPATGRHPRPWGWERDAD